MILKLVLAAMFFLVCTSCTAKEHQHKKEKFKATKSEQTTTTKSGAIAPKDYAAMLGRGLDVDWSKTDKGMQTYSTKMVQDFKQMGLGHVRIRVAKNMSDSLLNGVEKQIDDVLAAGMMPVLAYQADAFKNKPNEAELEKAVQWWQIAAEHFKNKSPKLSFDQIIEVTDALNKEPEVLNQYHERVTAAIRKTNPQRIVFISPRLRSDPEYLKDLKTPSQHNNYLMAEWHFYASGPAKNNPKKQWTTGTTFEKNLIQEKINTAKAWSQKTGIITWVGAWMPSNYNDGNDYTVKEQVAFATFVACELDKAGVPFAVNSDTKFYDAPKRQWIAGMQPVFKAFVAPSAC